VWTHTAVHGPENHSPVQVSFPVQFLVSSYFLLESHFTLSTFFIVSPTKDPQNTFLIWTPWLHFDEHYKYFHFDIHSYRFIVNWHLTSIGITYFLVYLTPLTGVPLVLTRVRSCTVLHCFWIFRFQTKFIVI